MNCVQGNIIKNFIMDKSDSKLKVEVWSDIMCPFCYIGKRHWEAALSQFGHSSEIELEWHSFQLK